MKSIGPSLPPDVAAYKRTPEFTVAAIPAGLLKDHATKAGVWGVIHVLAGRLRYVVDEAGIDAVVTVGTRAVIRPQQRHRIAPLTDDVRFFVEFLK